MPPTPSSDFDLEPRPRPGAAWAILAIGLMLVAVLAPVPGRPGLHPKFFRLVPLSAGGWLDVVENLALYLPLGLVLSLRGISRWRVGLTGMALSAVTELAQTAVPGRDPSATDVAANTCGAFLGWMMAAAPFGPGIGRAFQAAEGWTSRLLRPSPRLATACSLASALVATAVLMVTGFLLSPALPPGSRYFVQTPHVDQGSGLVRIGSGGDSHGFFSGLIDDVRIYDRALTAEAIQFDMAMPVQAMKSPPPDLVAAYGFDAAEASIALDDTGHGHDGRVRGASWIDRGRHGGAVSFDGRSGEVLVATTPAVKARDGLTLEAWVMPVGEPAEWPRVIARGSYNLYGSSGAGRYLAAAGGLFGGAPARAALVEPIPAGEWTHLASTYDGRTIRLYVNGALADSNRWWSSHQPATVSIDGVALPFGSAIDQGRAQSLLAGDPVLRAVVTCGERETGAAPVFALMAPGTINVVSLLSEGDDLLLRSATWARRLRLSSPDYRVAGAFRGCSPGQTLDVRVTGPFQHPRAELDGRDLRVSGLGLGSAWAFLIHSELLPVWLRACCTVACLGLLLVPFGFWMRQALPTVMGAVLLVGALWLTPRVWSIQPINTTQLAAICTGVLLGAIFQARSRLRAA